MAFLAPSIPSQPAPPPPPPPPPAQPDIKQIQSDTMRDEALYRKPKGKANNLLSGSLGDTSTPTTGTKSLLGQ